MKRIKEVWPTRLLFFLSPGIAAILIAGCFFMVPVNVIASDPGILSANSRKAYQEILCLKFDEARRTLQKVSESEPSVAITVLLENNMDFLRLMMTEEDKDFDRFFGMRQDRLQQLLKTDRSSPWFLFSQADIWLQSSFAKIRFGQNFSAAMDLNRAYRLLVENDKVYPGFLPNRIRLGLLHAIVGTVPSSYQWVMEVMNIEGSVSRGTEELEQAFRSVRSDRNWEFLLPETIFTLSYIKLNLLESKMGATELLEEFNRKPLSDWAQMSPLVVMTYANLLIKTGNNDKAITVLGKISSSSSLSYLDYLLGLAKLNRLDKDAHLPFLNYLAKFKGKNFIRSAYQHLAWYYLIQGDHEKYRIYMNRISLRGYSLVENDKQAEKDAAGNVKPDIYLLKARLLFDGAYYSKAGAELEAFTKSQGFANPGLRLEYTYRLARIYDESGKQNNALEWYRKTLELGRNNTSYYAANAALHTGMILEKMGKTELSERSYKECLSLQFEEYNQSITQKAKAGLNRLKNK